MHVLCWIENCIASDLSYGFYHSFKCCMFFTSSCVLSLYISCVSSNNSLLLGSFRCTDVDVNRTEDQFENHSHNKHTQINAYDWLQLCCFVVWWISIYRFVVTWTALTLCLGFSLYDDCVTVVVLCDLALFACLCLCVWQAYHVLSMQRAPVTRARETISFIWRKNVW